MTGWVVERGEVVVVVLDLRALDDLVAEPDEDVLDLAAGPGQRMQVPEPHRRGPGQGHVDRFGGEPAVELGPLVPLLGSGEQLLELAADLVARLADRPPLLRGQIADPAQDRRQLGLPPQEPDPGLLDRGSVRRGLDRSPCLLAYRFDPFQHLSARPPRADRRYPLQADRRRRGHVQRFRAALQGDGGAHVAGLEDDRRQAVALRPEAERRRPGELGDCRRRCRRRRARPARPSGRASPRPARAPAGSRTAPPCSPARPSASRDRRCRRRGPRGRRPGRRRSGRSSRRCRDRRPRAGRRPARRRSARPGSARSRSRAYPSRASQPRRADPARPRRRRCRCPAATSTSAGVQPASIPAPSRSSPSVANMPSRSRHLRSRSLRTSFSLSLSLLVIIEVLIWS